MCLVWFYICIEVCIWEHMTRFFFTSCVDRIVCVFYECWNIYTYGLHVWQMHYGVRVLDLQHRHVFRRFHMRCMLATLNAYALHLHICGRCGVCARLTWLFLEVSTHLYSTDTLTCARTHWRTRKGAAMAEECKPDCFLPLFTGKFTFKTTNYPRCRPQSSPDSAPWSK